MASEVEAIVGNWYKDEEDDAMFSVAAVDEDSDLIEIQELDGEFSEMSFAQWERRALVQIDEPDDWMIAMDGVDSEEFDFMLNEVDDAEWESDWQRRNNVDE